MVRLSFGYKMLRFFGLNYSEQEYGNVRLWQIVNRTSKTLRDAFLLKYLMDSALLSPISPRKLRPKVLSWVGCKVGKDVYIGAKVSIDPSHSNLIELEDHVHIAGHSILLCHQRNLSGYCVGDDYSKLPYILGRITLKKGCLLGMHSMIMPGVTIGEGAIIGAYSLVTRDIPAWTIATGRPAKIVKQIPERIIL